MDRRRFLATLGTSAVSAPLVPFLPKSSVLAGRFSAWAWVHGSAAGAPAEWRARFSRLREMGVEGVLVGGGDTALLAEAARSAGVALHRWVWILNRSGDDVVKRDHPEWFSVNRLGESSLTHPPYVPYYQWLCPTRPEVREYLRAAVAAVAANPLVAGVHLDYIRHPDVILPRGLWAKYGLVQDHELPQFDFCYCPVCRDAFLRQSGTDPLELPDPAQDSAWRQFRWRAVTDVVRTLSQELHRQGKQVTAAVFPTPALARRLVRQAWDTWPLDGVFPMLYHSFYEEPVGWIGTGVREGVTALAGRFPLYAGLYLPSLTPAELGEAVRTARAAGGDGVSLFEMGGISEPHAAALRDALRS